MTTTKTYAVLTGDLVGSTPLAKAAMDAARKRLHAAVAALGDAGWAGRRRLVRGEPEFFRGDAWQCLLTDPRWALRSAIFLRASMLAGADVDTRVSVGIGPVKTISRTRVSLSRGEAFALSGHGLDERMGSRYRLAVQVPKSWRMPVAGWLESIARLCDSVVVQWEGRQIEVARLACLHPDASQAEIGAMLRPKATQQGVAKSMRSAGWHGLQDALERFEGEAWNNL